LIHRLPVSHKKLSLEFRLKRLLGGMDLPPDEAHLYWRLVLSEAEKADLWAPRIRDAIAAAPAVRHFTGPYALLGPEEPLGKLMRLDAAVFLPDDLMIKNDRMSMAHSIEARVPFTDPDLTEFMSRVPSRLKLPGLRKKHVMRASLSGVLPDVILNKKKVGLEIPYSRWLRHELKDLVDRHLGPSHLAATGLFDPSSVRRLVTEHQAGRRDHGRALWGLLNVMLWLDLYQPEVG
jgi:asparagine synthase (glutamine-hydrolysing)